MDQLRHRQRLAPEAGDEALVVGEVLGEDLHRDGALEDQVGRLVDVRHPAGAEPLAGLVAPGEGSRLHHSPPPTPPGRPRPRAPVSSAFGCAGGSASAFFFAFAVRSAAAAPVLRSSALFFVPSSASFSGFSFFGLLFVFQFFCLRHRFRARVPFLRGASSSQLATTSFSRSRPFLQRLLQLRVDPVELFDLAADLGDRVFGADAVASSASCLDLVEVAFDLARGRPRAAARRCRRRRRRRAPAPRRRRGRGRAGVRLRRRMVASLDNGLWSDISLHLSDQLADLEALGERGSAGRRRGSPPPLRSMS